MPAIAAYQIAVKQGDAALEKMAARKDIKAEVDYFRNNIQSVKSVDDLFKDRRMMQFVLDATDLGKETDKMGLIKKVLTQKAEDSDALMNKLVDKRFKAAASLLQLGEKGLAQIQRETTKDDLAELYVKNKYDAGLAKQNSGVPLAMYFKENASGCKEYLRYSGRSAHASRRDDRSRPASGACQPIGGGAGGGDREAHESLRPQRSEICR